ncbi:hypothetical protein F4777DRAFT_578631 [Nemania sp. FL0916]|nr:hypothetical protein F4777DRAFT_578631 [Nemania sp. FL0916]
MSIGIRDLSDELIVRLTNVLARRPEYGISRPSRRWLQRQEEKIRNLPKELLRPSGFFQRLAIKIADHFDPDIEIVDPRAILCATHAKLNPFLIRRIFIALAYEVTVYADPLRSWQGVSSNFELSALVGRLDSITALWTEPALFHEIYGLTPFDSHHVYVDSACEACCLAAVGASGRALADLRAALLDRKERRSGNHAQKKPPRLLLLVEAWINHLRKEGSPIDRAEECRAWSEDLLTDLRTVRPQIIAWRAEQKRHHAALRAARRPVYSELRRTKAGAAITPLTGHSRRTRNGIPIALADAGDREAQRAVASSRNSGRSVYRPDSLDAFSEVHDRQRAAYNLPTGRTPRPGAPEPARTSGLSNEAPGQSLIDQFEQEIPLDDPDEEQEFNEESYMEATRAKVQAWYSKMDGSQSVLSMVHPAFRPSIPASAVPDSLHPKKDDKSQDGRDDAATNAGWTDITVHTADPSCVGSNTRDAPRPPVPRIPSTYKPKEPYEPLNWPAPPQGRPPANNTRPSLARSDSSFISSQRHEFLVDRFKAKDSPAQLRPQSPLIPTAPSTRTSVYDRGSVTTVSNLDAESEVNEESLPPP